MRRPSIGHTDKHVWQPNEYGTSSREFAGGEGVVSGFRGDSIKVNRDAVNHRPSRRYIIGLLVLLFTTTTIYTQFFRNTRTEMAIPIPDAPQSDDKHGASARPDFTNMIKVQDLDAQYVPSTGEDKGEGRLVIVGDVHGMKNELVKLLDKVSFNKQKDHLILVGDLITKGYDSLGVIDLAMELEASAVRGNHEDRVLLAYEDMKAKQAGLPGSDDEASKEDRTLAKSLNPTQVEWLKKLPVILRVGKLGGMGEVVVVHAGLVAGVSLEAQDAYQAMNMRTIDMHSHVPSDSREGHSWTKLWNHYQKQLPKHERSTVIYGHDSKRGLRIEDYTKGIDTGCRKGHKLTALVISSGATDVHQHLVQLKCEKAKHKIKEMKEEEGASD